MRIIINQDVVVQNLQVRQFNDTKFQTFGIIVNKDKVSNKNYFISCSYWGDIQLKSGATISAIGGVLKLKEYNGKTYVQLNVEDFNWNDTTTNSESGKFSQSVVSGETDWLDEVEENMKGKE